MKPGKGISIWRLKTIGGSLGLKSIEYCAEKAADIIADAGMVRVDIKAADGPYKFGPNELTPAIADIFRRRGISVWGWGFCYGNDAIGEGNIAAQETLRLDLDGWWFDCEGKFEGQTGNEGRFLAMHRTFRNLCPQTPTAYCGWAKPWNPKTGSQWHPAALYKTAMACCNYAMMMAYWSGQTVADAIWELETSFGQWRKITTKPFIPELRAYDGDAGKATADAIVHAGQYAKDSGFCDGVGWWGLDWCYNRPDLLAALKATPGWEAGPSPIPDDTAEVPFLEMPEARRNVIIRDHLIKAGDIRI